MTAQAVQTARQFKEALRTNDRAYTQLFGMGSIMPTDQLHTLAQIEAKATALSDERFSTSPHDAMADSQQHAAAGSTRDAATVLLSESCLKNMGAGQPLTVRCPAAPTSKATSLPSRGRRQRPMRITAAPLPAFAAVGASETPLRRKTASTFSHSETAFSARGDSMRRTFAAAQEVTDASAMSSQCHLLPLRPSTAR